MGLSTYRQMVIPLTNTRTLLTLPPVGNVGTSDDSASELMGTRALRRWSPLLPVPLAYSSPVR